MVAGGRRKSRLTPMKTKMEVNEINRSALNGIEGEPTAAGPHRLGKLMEWIGRPPNEWIGAVEKENS